MGNDASKPKSKSTPNRSQPKPATDHKRTTDNQLNTASKTGTLNISNKGLHELPKSIENLTNLRQINASKNKLNNQAIAILSKLPNLQKIDLSHNQISDFSLLFQLQKLKSLDISHNNIIRLPQVGMGKNLTKVDMSFNKVTSLQQDNLTTINQNNENSNNFFEGLNNLDLSNNSISSIPENLSSSSLIELNLNNNRISNLSASNFVENCKSLKVLRLKNNQLKITEFSKDFLEKSQVSTLEYEGNLFDGKSFKEMPGYDDLAERMTKLVMKKE